MSTFKGTYTVMITPFSEDGRSVNETSLNKFVNWQIEQGIHGLIPLGSTGEFLSLSDEERYQVAKNTIECAAGRVPVLVGTAAENTWDAVRYSKEAESLGADGVMIIPPFYSTPTHDELFQHFKLISDAISLPIMIYNNPATSNVDMQPELVARLAQIDNVAYIKESTMDVTRVRDIIELCGERMTVFGGIMGYESFLNGAHGWVAVGSNILPNAFAELYTLTAEKQDIAQAKQLYRDILPIIRLVGGHRYVTSSKAALNCLGMNVGDPRPPRLPVSESEMVSIRKTLASVRFCQIVE